MTTDPRKPRPTKRKRRKKRRARDLPEDAQRSTKMKPRRAVIGDRDSWGR